MKESTSKEKILKGIRNALINVNPNPFNKQEENGQLFVESDDFPDVTFAKTFTELGGKFVYCETFQKCIEALNYLAVKNDWQEVFALNDGVANLLIDSGIKVQNDESEFENIKVGAETCELLVAQTGSILVSSKANSGRRLNVYPETHLIFAQTKLIVPHLKDAFSYLNKKYGKTLPSSLTFITGPSRTADIEKTLVFGAHGPKNIYVFLIDQ